MKILSVIAIISLAFIVVVGFAYMIYALVWHGDDFPNIFDQ